MQTPRRRKVIPAKKAWLFQNKAPLALVRKGLAEARNKQFSKTPRDLDADACLARRLADAEKAIAAGSGVTWRKVRSDD